MSDEKRWWSRARYYFRCIGFIGVGVGTAYVAHEYPSLFHWPWLAILFNEVGTAISIAGTLGLFVEPFFKTEFGRDVFEAAYRYVLPTEFKDEVGKILRLQLVAEKQVWTVTIEKIKNDETTVLVSTSFDKTVVNKSNSFVQQEALYTVPELRYKNGQVEIKECSIETEDDKEHHFTLEEGYDLKANTRKLSIRPKGWARISGKAIQYRKTTDLVFENFMTPAINPVIEVFKPDDFDYDVQFGNKDKWVKEKFTNRHQLLGIYLPGQTMWVRWWPKDAAKGASG